MLLVWAQLASGPLASSLSCPSLAEDDQDEPQEDAVAGADLPEAALRASPDLEPLAGRLSP